MLDGVIKSIKLQLFIVNLFQLELSKFMIAMLDVGISKIDALLKILTNEVTLGLCPTIIIVFI